MIFHTRDSCPTLAPEITGGGLKYAPTVKGWAKVKQPEREDYTDEDESDDDEEQQIVVPKKQQKKKTPKPKTPKKKVQRMEKKQELRPKIIPKAKRRPKASDIQTKP